MDPNEALKNARHAGLDLRRERDGGNCEDIHTAADDLAEAFEALDGWLSKGGFLPDAWKR
jgi:hypothetical protein